MEIDACGVLMCMCMFVCVSCILEFGDGYVVVDEVCGGFAGGG